MSSPGTPLLKRARLGRTVNYLGSPDQLVRLSEHYVVDEEETVPLRGSRRVEDPR
jgi:hypothetical protein